MAALGYVVWLDGEPYGPGEVPAGVAARITNPAAWEGGVLPSQDTAPPVVSPEPSVPDSTGEGESGTSPDDPETPVVPDPLPPRPAVQGAGSAKEKWLEYAQALGVEVGHDMTRDEIVAAVDAAAEQS